jgi:hypothetical protein
LDLARERERERESKINIKKITYMNLHNLKNVPNSIGVIKSRRVNLEGCVDKW